MTVVYCTAQRTSCCPFNGSTHLSSREACRALATGGDTRVMQAMTPEKVRAMACRGRKGSQVRFAQSSDLICMAAGRGPQASVSGAHAARCLHAARPARSQPCPGLRRHRVDPGRGAMHETQQVHANARDCLAGRTLTAFSAEGVSWPGRLRVSQIAQRAA